MKIGIVGSGNVGRSLGVLWAEHGHEVFFGSRNLEHAQAAAAYTRDAPFGSNAEAAKFGEVILWTLPPVPAAEAIDDAELVAGKVVIDTTNAPLREDGRLGPAQNEISLAERLALDLPEARVVKAFNTVSIEVHELSPTPLRDFAVSVFLAGDDAEAKALVSRLALKIGYFPVDCGPLKAARMLEGLADFTRYVTRVTGQAPYAALSLYALPEAKSRRLGGRTPSEPDKTE
jgi:8-hydroxy-5-deazaflavin:NADPH oxidoreductase